MHKIFQIDEVVKEITRHMSEWYTQRFILYLALSCKTISDPALDVLWETQCTLIDLLKTFPSDVWEVNQGKLHITRTPTRQEWNRFEKYRYRICNLRVDEGPGLDGLSARVYQLLDLYFPNGSLLPNLQRLTCFINWEYFVWIKLFFSPSLFFIDLNTLGNNPDPIAGPVLGLLPMDTLQMLRLEGVILDADSMKMLSDRLFNLSTPLQELITYHKISNEAAIHISKLSNLRTLGISFRKSNFTLPEATDVFPSLDCLITLKSMTTWTG